MIASLTRARAFTGEVVDELKKVTWPDTAQLRNATFVIIVFVIVVALIIWMMDTAVSWILGLVIDLFAG